MGLEKEHIIKHKVEVRPYRDGDVFEITIRKGDQLGGGVTDLDCGLFSLWVDDEVVACTGIRPEGKNGLVWSFVSDDARGHGKVMIRMGRKMLRHGIEVLKFNRMYALVRADKEEYSRFIETIGFTREGLLRKASANGKDLYIYSVIEEDLWTR